MRKIIKTIFCVLAVASLASCSGGGSSNAGGKDDSPSTEPSIDETPITSTPISTTYIYRADKAADKIYFGSLDLTTGTLAEHDAIDLSSGDQPHAIVLSADQKYLFAINTGSNTIDTFEIDSSTGELSLVASRNSFLATLHGRVVVDSQNRFLWSYEEDASHFYYLIAYKIEANGSLTYSSTSIISGGTDVARNMAIHSSGDYLYVNLEHSGVMACSVSVTGSTTVLGGSYGGFSPMALAFNSTVSRLFGTPPGGDLILSSEIDGSGDVSSSTYMDAGPALPYMDLAVNDSGDRMYFVVGTPALVKSYVLNTAGSGSLTALNSVSLASGCAPTKMAALMDDDYLVVPCADGSGLTYSLKIEADGSVTQMDVAKRTGMKVNSIAIATF